MNVNSHHQELYEQALKLHENNKGKLSVEIKTPVTKREDLALVYTPGVGEPSKRIAEHKENVKKTANHFTTTKRVWVVRLLTLG